MTDPSNSSDWSVVDSQPDTDEFAAYLEQATGFEQVMAYKHRSHELLHLADGDQVLDAGCGIGDDALQLADRVGPVGAVVGIDNSEALIQEARERGADLPTVRFQVGDIYDLDAPADRFDASRADRVFQHLEEPAAALAELKRVTRPGGRIGLTDPDWESVVITVPGEPAAHDVLDPRYVAARKPASGRLLYGFAREAGLVDIDIDGFVFHSTSFEFVQEMGDLENTTEAMRSDGVISGQELESWFDRLEHADDSGQFFSAMPAYTVVGTVPA